LDSIEHWAFVISHRGVRVERTAGYGKWNQPTVLADGHPGLSNRGIRAGGGVRCRLRRSGRKMGPGR
jgi:hypothetical protein